MKRLIMALLMAGTLAITIGTNTAEARRFRGGWNGPVVYGGYYSSPYAGGYYADPYYGGYYASPYYYGNYGYPYGYSYSVTPGFYGNNFGVSPYGFYFQF